MPEFDSAGSVFHSRPQHLAALLAERAEPARLWRVEELGAIFRHQLSAPVIVDLGGFDPATALRLRHLSEAQGLVLKSFGELFRHPAPPLELLQLTKDFAKLNRDHPESCLPPEIALALYYLAIAAAWVRLGKRITQLPDAELRRGLAWTRGQSWVEGETRKLLDAALAGLPAGGGTEATT